MLGQEMGILAVAAVKERLGGRGKGGFQMLGQEMGRFLDGRI